MAVGQNQDTLTYRPDLRSGLDASHPSPFGGYRGVELTYLRGRSLHGEPGLQVLTHSVGLVVFSCSFQCRMWLSVFRFLQLPVNEHPDGAP